MHNQHFREIPYNYTSADDSQIIRLLFGDDIWYALIKVRVKRTTGRLARLLMRFMGDMFMVHRNPYLLQELISNHRRCQSMTREMTTDLALIANKSEMTEELQFILDQCRLKVSQLSANLSTIKEKRRRLLHLAGDIIGKKNIRFDPFTLISHVTDATDWRLHLPFAVVWPSAEDQVSPLLETIAELGLHAIPRGAGTGLTGGAVPVAPHCVIINTEKLNHIHGIEYHLLPHLKERERKVPVLRLEAGVVTGDAIAYAQKHNLIFATDPTSAWSCTIGGNIAENAGGKKAVLWGTAIDNIWSFTMAVPGGRKLEIRRLDHPLRKIYPEDKVRFEVYEQGQTSPLRTISLDGTEIRKKGLGKDITNKALKGLPGIQKEGTDGVIISAGFILYPAYSHKITGCLEFFGDDMDEAARVISDISKVFVNKNESALMALEHFDEEYVRAIQYKSKAPRHESPKAVILIDLVANRAEHLVLGQQNLRDLLNNYRQTELFFAADDDEAERYWQDRKKLGAIAARTNAFKLNEDIVIPIPALAEFADFIDRFNIEENRYNQKSVVWQLRDYLETVQPQSDPQWLSSKIRQALLFFDETLQQLTLSGKKQLRLETHIKQLLRNLQVLFRGYTKILSGITEIYNDTRLHLIVIATHMHAGDGNVHVNIPVFSNDRDMMIRAMETADAVMAKAIELEGVVSGEHGIGFTKFNYLDPLRIRELTEYRNEIDPNHIINPGKLTDPQIPTLIFTPSFNLLRLESEILKYGSLKELSDMISKCIRCGKCKADCCVFYPAKQLYFHPRNKNLAIGALIEVILYDAQRFRSTRFGFLSYLEEIADHCTICHKCAAPCPVSIDTGEVTIVERRLLETQKYKNTPYRTLLTLSYLKSQSPVMNSLFRKSVLQWAVSLQRLAFRLNHLMPDFQTAQWQTLKMLLNAPVTKVSRQPLSAILPPYNTDQALVIHPPDQKYTVFYFPGCGSERLFSNIGLASIYILLKSGALVVLPPKSLCCGFPVRVNAKIKWEEKEALRNIIIFNQLRSMFHHIKFDELAVSCGTCLEALQRLDLEAIFNAEISDVIQIALRNGLGFKNHDHFLYHQPCHDSLNGQAVPLLLEHGVKKMLTVPSCCSEAGTLALSRPDIAYSMRVRKQAALRKAIDSTNNRPPLLTNCPACIQGLGRHTQFNLTTKHIAEVLAEDCGGPLWMSELLQLVKSSEVVNI